MQTNINDFLIKNRVLVGYRGPGGNVYLPSGIIAVADKAFANNKKLINVRVSEGVTALGSACFERCTNLRHVILPSTVTGIGESCFSGCESLVGVNIPSGIGTIPAWAFARCGSLQRIRLPSAVSLIDERAFMQCSQLGNIAFPKALKSIGASAFTGCNSLTRIELPEGLVRIDRFAFRACERLISAGLPQTLHEIGDSAFEECSELRTVDLPDGLAFLGSSAFKGCRRLEAFKLPEGLTEIKKETFYGCESIKNIAFPPSVASIGSKAFGGCSGLTSVTIPETVVSLGSGAFIHSGIQRFEIKAGKMLIGGSLLNGICEKGSLDRLIARRWMQGMSEAFANCEIKRIELEDMTGVVPERRRAAVLAFIEEKAAAGEGEREKQQRKYIKNNALRLMDAAFEEPGLLRFMCDNGLIDANTVDAFIEKALSLGSAELSAAMLDYQQRIGMRSIAEARSRRERMKDNYTDRWMDRAVSRPDEGIRGLCFSVTGKLEYWTGRNRLKEYLESCGAKLSGSVGYGTDFLVVGQTEPKAGTGTANMMLDRANALGVSIITEEEFNLMIGARFRNEPLVEVPLWLREIRPRAFMGCEKVESVKLHDGIASIGQYAFASCVALKNIELPKGLKTIEEGTFEKCRSLVSLALPEGVKEIKRGAFSGAGLRSIRLPEGVESIGAQAFERCADLIRAHLPGSLKTIESSAFCYCPKLTIFAPRASTASAFAAVQRFPTVLE